MRALITVALLAVAAGRAAAQPSAAELAPDSVSPTGVKYWKNPLIAAKANNFTAFAAAVSNNGLEGDLGASNLTATVFVPTDAAFKNLTDSTDASVHSILDNPAKLKSVLTYHVVPGATLTAARIKDLVAKEAGKKREFKTLQGEPIVASLDGDKLLINGVAVSTPVDVQGGKTMLLALDGVVLPPSVSGVVPKGMNATSATVAAAAAAVKAAAPASGAAAASVAAALLAAPALLAALL